MSPAAIHNDETSLAIIKLHKEQQRTRADNPVTATIEQLPVELLIEIFVHCSGIPTSSDLPQITISQVCHFWREIILHIPRAWQLISLDDRLRSFHASHAQACFWLDRSQNFPVDIRINLADSDNFLALVSPLLEHVHRWRRLTVVGELQEDLDFSAFSRDASQAVCEHLTVTLKGQEPDLLAVFDETQHSRKLFHCSAPLDLGFGGALFHRITLHAEVSKLPIPQHLVSTYIQVLVIKETPSDNMPDPRRFINFLSCLPELKVLHYIALPHEPTPPTLRISLPIVHLSRLHTLVLRSTCAIRAILSHIATPNLRELYLEHTNMEFHLPHAAASATDLEEGDSDDEAADFSQSPWTDHATGMGLRSLLSRSNPPLEVLEMDYADMRTKDFLWCFDRLDTLQEFRIVASDMSDKVISMLAPYQFSEPSRGRLNSDHLEGPETTMEQTRVRMPKLAALELWNCQRLTGHAVVAALGARVRHTDQVADRNAFSKLSDVAIINCVDFLPHHVASLQPVLGGRLRTQT